MHVLVEKQSPLSRALRSNKENAPTSPSVNPPSSTSQSSSKRPLPLEFSDDDNFQKGKILYNNTGGPGGLVG